MKFLDIKTDFAFKKVFASKDSKHRLISFLNSIIYSSNEQKITDLTIVDPYNIPMLRGMKDSFVDVQATLNDNTTVIIEMQILACDGFEKRVLYNAAKNYSVQLVKGEDYTLLNPVIALSIVDFNMFETKKTITRFKLLEKEEFIDYTDDLELIFVELPKFTKELDSLDGIKDEWIWFVKNAGSLEFIPQNISHDVQDALEVVNEAGMTQEELDLQHRKKDFIWLQKTSLETAERKGLKAGLEKGIEQGIEKGLEKGIEQGIEKGLEKGIEQGIEQGLEKGIEQGIEKGIEQGLEKGIEGVLSMYGFDIEPSKIATNFNISEEKVVQMIKNIKENI